MSIRFDSELAMFSDFKTFYNSLADIQFIYGKRPTEQEVESILVQAWNYLCLEEEKLDQDLELL